MFIKSYFVEHILQTRIGPTQTPIYQRTISLGGQPQEGGTMDHIQLHFSTDSNAYSQNIIIDDRLKKVTAWFPMEEFEYYYQYLNHKKGTLKATFIQSQAQQFRRLEFIANGIPPLND